MRRMKDIITKAVPGTLLALAIFASFTLPANAIDARKAAEALRLRKASRSATCPSATAAPG